MLSEPTSFVSQHNMGQINLPIVFYISDSVGQRAAEILDRNKRRKIDIVQDS